MIPVGVQVFLALEPVDMRLSFERLSGIATGQMAYEARCGALFVFFGRRRDALKVLSFDGTGMCTFSKRLDRGTFRIPDPPREGDRPIEVDDATLEALLDGVEVVLAVTPRTRRMAHGMDTTFEHAHGTRQVGTHR